MIHKHSFQHWCCILSYIQVKYFDQQMKIHSHQKASQCSPELETLLPFTQYQHQVYKGSYRRHEHHLVLIFHKSTTLSLDLHSNHETQSQCTQYRGLRTSD